MRSALGFLPYTIQNLCCVEAMSHLKLSWAPGQGVLAPVQGAQEPEGML